MADATSVLNEIVGGLESLAADIISRIGEDRTFLEMWGWTSPAMTRQDFAAFIRKPIELIRQIDSKNISDEDMLKLQAIPPTITFMLANTMPNMTGGNAFHGFIVVQSLVERIADLISKYKQLPPFDIAALEDKKILPAQQIKQLRVIEKSIELLGVENEDLERKVAAIKAAHDVAEALPADIQALEDARSRYAETRTELEVAVKAATAAQTASQAIQANLTMIESDARKVLERANSAYSAATTIGLGRAFSERAQALGRSTLILGLVLIAALAGGGFITYQRVDFVHALMLKPSVDYNVLWLNVTFTALSVSAPVWLAWLLTRQIGQRFRLAEDYSYKASVAKAYEGYRAEAAQIDVELAKKLFSIALDQLSEAPLRLVEKESPGSPVHEAQGPLARLFFGGGGRTNREPKRDAPEPESGH